MTLTSSGTLSAPSVHVTHPPLSVLKFPPASGPQALSPPQSDFTLARPFNIDPELYNNLLHVAYPITIAIFYATTVTYLNRLNKRRDNKPWAFSKTTGFYCFVVLHNVFLAVYSGWTFVGMFHAIRRSWPGWEGEYGLAGAMDALCKIHGPRGLGSAATYNSTTSSWGFTDSTLKLLDNSPDTLDVGRIWNEGLAFYGWLFYLSKFYEVVDTLVVLAKGKTSSTLQTYHHAGAMLSMWAGIRYMSPPIWMFVFINSGLHALMYTYYTLLTLSIPVPRAMKQTLTTLQIAQIGFGASYALAHLFIAYDIPVSIPYVFVHNLTSAIPAAASSVSSAAAGVTATAGVGSWLKKLALRAAGEEGLAENVRNQHGETFGIDAVHAAEVEKAQEEIRYKTQYQTVNCVDTSGQAFAILLNCLYLAPLLLLFVRFFVRTYLRGSRAPPPKPTQKQLIKESGKDAARNVEKEIKDAMDEEGTEDTEMPENVKAKINDAKSRIRKGADDLSAKAKHGVKNASDAAKEKVSSAKGQMRKQEAKPNGEQSQQSKAQAEESKKPKDQSSNGQSQQSKPQRADSGESKDRPNSAQSQRSKPDSNKSRDQPKGSSPPQDKEGAESEQPKDEANNAQSQQSKPLGEDSKKPRDEPKSGSTSQDKENDEPQKDASAYEANLDDLKSDEEKKVEEEMQPVGKENEEPKKAPMTGLDESAYEINVDEIKSEEEMKAEAEMQPKAT